MRRIEEHGGWLHEPPGRPVGVVALTHGAGSNCDAPFLKAVAEALAGAGYVVLRYDMLFRRKGVKTLTYAQQIKDREGIRQAVHWLRGEFPKLPLVLAGHSYGGRQSSILGAEDTTLADALLLLSYPLHPPKEPDKLRIDHFAKLTMPVLFVHGTRDPFGTVEEMQSAIRLIPGPAELKAVEKGAHNLPETAAALIPGWLSAMMKK